MNHESDGWKKSSTLRSKHLFQHSVHNYLYASSDLVRGLDFNNMVDAFVLEMVRKEYLVSSQMAHSATVFMAGLMRSITVWLCDQCSADRCTVSACC